MLRDIKLTNERETKKACVMANQVDNQTDNQADNEIKQTDNNIQPEAFSTPAMAGSGFNLF